MVFNFDAGHQSVGSVSTYFMGVLKAAAEIHKRSADLIYCIFFTEY